MAEIWNILACVVCIYCVFSTCSAADCGQDDFHFEYTTCDEKGERWRVSVPKKDSTCTPKSGNSYGPPVKGTPCDKECENGNYLDMSIQDCKECPSGTYSSGSSALFEDWDSLPTGFSTTTESFIDYAPDDDDKPADCKSFEWTPKGSYLAAVPGDCSAKLIYSASLIKAGSITFEYQLPSSSTIFHVTKKGDVENVPSVDTNPVTVEDNSEWTPKGSYIAAVPGDCLAKLIYSASLIKAGSITFEYQLPTSSTIFRVAVQNDQCQASGDKDSSKWPENTDDGEWKTISIPLKSGFNVIQWRLIGMVEEGASPQPVLVRKVTVKGLAYNSNCASCSNGTYSSGGAGHCSPCKVNTWSGRGASTCIPCDTKTQYATPGSSECSAKLACTAGDYYQLMKPCQDGKTSTTYAWIQPMICNQEPTDSVKLPNDSDPIDCLPCNPGMHLNVNQTCAVCPAEHMTDGHDCIQCGASTSPDYGYFLQNWNSIPDFIKSTCVSFSEKECNKDTKWLPFGDSLISHFARGESAYLVLSLRVGGFRTTQSSKEGGVMTIGQITLTFETQCEAFCQLVFLSDESGSEEVINIWEYKQAKTTYVHDVKTNGSFTYTLAFQNSGWLLSTTEVRDTMAKIYSIEVTNTIDGGAKQCQKCPKGSNQDGCLPCKNGEYIDPVTVTCTKCPPGTAVESHNSYGAESCKPCGEGLTVYKGQQCMSDGHFTSTSGKVFDMTNLTTSQFLKGSLLFTSGGTQYYHGFNISLLGNPDVSKVICQNNVTKTDTNATREPQTLVSRICRSTMVPASGDSGDVVSTQSTSLGEKLVKIVHNQTELDVDGNVSSIKTLYKSSGFDDKDLQNDIQVHFAAKTATHACPKGRSTVVSLRCDLEQKGVGEIQLPPKCADGTCDGCTFHFMWHTRAACPLCVKEDYTNVIGECVSGEQTIHYFPPEHCIVKDGQKKLEEKQKCVMHLTSLPLMFQIAIPVVVGFAMILFCLLCFIWRKNKKLEYRYMKLVEGSGTGEDGELPAADSCGLEEDEDEMGDSVQIRDSKGARFFKKLSNKIKKSDDAFESAIMNERMPLT